MIKLLPIELEPFPIGKSQRKSCEDDRIKSNTSYLVKIYNYWYAGRFSKQWYGWNFNNWGTSGIQLNSIEGPIYEIVEE